MRLYDYSGIFTAISKERSPSVHIRNLPICTVILCSGQFTIISKISGKIQGGIEKGL